MKMPSAYDIRPQILTLSMLEKMEPHQVFAHGYMEKLHPWFNNLEMQTAWEKPSYLTVQEKDGYEEAAQSLELPHSRYRLVKWLAIRGGIHDWGIYHSIDANICTHPYFDCDCHLLSPWEQIARCGAKLRDEREIRAWVPCDDEAFNMYRF